MQIIVRLVSRQERLPGKTICWLSGSVLPGLASVSAILFALPVGRSR